MTRFWMTLEKRDFVLNSLKLMTGGGVLSKKYLQLNSNLAKQWDL